MKTDNIEQTAFLQQWAETQIIATSALQNLLLEQHSALHRWILASQLAVNGGAAVAVLNSNAIQDAAQIFAVASFTVGILAAFLCAELDQKSLQHGLTPNIRMLGFWVKFKHTGDFDEASMQEILGDSVLASQKTALSRIAGWLPIVMFAIGVFGAGLSLWGIDIKEIVCLVGK